MKEETGQVMPPDTVKELSKTCPCIDGLFNNSFNYL